MDKGSHTTTTTTTRRVGIGVEGREKRPESRGHKLSYVVTCAFSSRSRGKMVAIFSPAFEPGYLPLCYDSKTPCASRQHSRFGDLWDTAASPPSLPPALPLVLFSAPDTRLCYHGRFFSRLYRSSKRPPPPSSSSSFSSSSSSSLPSSSDGTDATDTSWYRVAEIRRARARAVLGPRARSRDDVLPRYKSPPRWCIGVRVARVHPPRRRAGASSRARLISSSGRSFFWEPGQERAHARTHSTCGYVRAI